MSQENKREDMRTEYDIRGGLRGKYFSRYVASRVSVLGSASIHVEATASTASLGTHPDESTVRFVAEPVYQSIEPVTR
jgi:hypothetical protein